MAVSVECAGQGKRDYSISSVLSGLIELSELEVGVKVDDNQITWYSHVMYVMQYQVKTTLPLKRYCIYHIIHWNFLYT